MPIESVPHPLRSLLENPKGDFPRFRYFRLLKYPLNCDDHTYESGKGNKILIDTLGNVI